MKRFILLSFAFLALGFYELSGGAGFDPEANRVAQIEARKDRDVARIAALPSSPGTTIATAEPTVAPQDAAPSLEVTRAALNLVSFETATQPDDLIEEAAVAKPTADSEGPEISQLAAERELSLAALQDAPSAGQAVAFAGNSVSASSRVATPDLDIRTVKGTLVNMRSGPGTDYDVVDQLSQSTRVEILTDTGNGWVELRPLDGGVSGWMAAFLLSDG